MRDGGSERGMEGGWEGGRGVSECLLNQKMTTVSIVVNLLSCKTQEG